MVPHLTYTEALVVGLIQGVTELFPVSSLGHNVLIPALIGGQWARDLNVSAPKSPYLAFIVGMHVATAIAMIIYFWRDWLRIIAGFFTSIRHRRIETADQKLAWMIVLATIPIGIVGALLQHVVQDTFAKPVVTAVFLAVNGLVLFGGERLRRRELAGAPQAAGPVAGADEAVVDMPAYQDPVIADETVVDMPAYQDPAIADETVVDMPAYQDPAIAPRGRPGPRGRRDAGSWDPRWDDQGYQGGGYQGGGYQGGGYERGGYERGGSGERGWDDRGWDDQGYDRGWDEGPRAGYRAGGRPPAGGRHSAGHRAARQAGLGEGLASDARLARLGYRRGVFLGTLQILALLPGISRDGVVMVGGMFRGLSRQDAARFSFLLSAPVIFAAGVLKLPDLMGPDGHGIRGQVLAGSILSGIGAYLALRLLMRWLQKPAGTLVPFALYCLIVGLGSAAYLTVR